ncbi:hypothetical protein FEM48_Zijuj09G0158900 [Ziziphus jujuba var. spinosa]|uniref:Amino acid transporter transmembrane domain-containing protein n=1 Tax=Ziziphus jujuba var. spinosa TaxID=714518 RepID=A0A978UTX0_ZIZJJ|nr:hypothetical protein FEM48_Zijuj09G0158900 [Ziziphus jujuba var. spinosa]
MMGETNEISSAPITPRPVDAASRPPAVSVPPAQYLSGGKDTANTNKTPKSLTPKSRTPRFITPIGSPVRRALRLTRLNPQDAWLPITESQNGNAFYAAFHTLCSGIGIQALVFPVAFTFLGWTWGVICFTVGFIWQLYTLYLLVQLHESPETGIRYCRYMQLSNATFGYKLSKILSSFPILNLSAGSCVAAIIIGGSTAKSFFQIICGATCTAKPLTMVEWYLVFTCIAVVFAQLPNLNSIAGVSLIGAITAVGYCTIIWVVSVAKGRLPMVSYNPVRHGSQTEQVFDILNALGMIAFAFRGHNLILEIQSTMPSNEKHPSRVPMWRGVKGAYLIVALCLYPLGIGGYWAYGQMIYGMPMFDDIESQYTRRMKQPCPWWLRAILRVLFGFSCFFVAVAIPFLGSLGGLIGGVSLPVTLAYPCFMWLKIKKPKIYSPIWFLNWVLGIGGMLLSVVLSVAGVYVIIQTGIHANFFKPQ